VRRSKRVVLSIAAAAVVAGGTILVITAGNARGYGGDRSAASSYLHARLGLMHALVAEIPAGVGPMNAFVASVRAECAGALGGAPVNARPEGTKEGATDEELLAGEGSRGLEIAERSVDMLAVEEFASTVRRLRWRDQRLTALVRTLAEIEIERVRMHPPDLCSQIGAWAATGYRTLPHETEEPSEPGGRTLARELAAVGCEFESPQEAVVSLLRRYRRSGVQPTTRQVELAESRWSVLAARASLPAQVALERALDVHVPPKVAGKRGAHKRRNAPPRPYTSCTGRQEPIVESFSE
jgi:hypothetical protein